MKNDIQRNVLFGDALSLKISVHRVVLWVLTLEFLLFPILAILDLGFSVNLRSNYFLRFSYLLVLGLAVAYLVAQHRRGIQLTCITMMFLGALAVGGTKGLLDGHLNRAFLSHIMFCLIPIVMVSYGGCFFDAYQRSEKLRNQFRRTMYWAMFVGLFAVLVFNIGYMLGLADYNAIGLWNFTFSAPFLLYQPYGVIFFALSILGVWFAAKRGVMVVFFFYIIWAVLFRIVEKRHFFLWAIAGVVMIIGLAAGSYILLDESASRLHQTVGLLAVGDINAASGGRWQEASSALEILMSRFDHFLFGAGFGAQFLPWPDRPGYCDYYSHYTHFSFVSYMWLGGFLFAVGVYSYLVVIFLQMFIKVKKGLISRDYYFFVYMLGGVIVLSIFGAVLMNNPWGWFFVGCCIHLNRVSQPDRELRY